MDTDLIWWITAFELPALAALFLMIRRTRQDQDKANDDLHDKIDRGLAAGLENLSAYKLEVAKNYASIYYMKDVERRLTSHLVRIENKLDNPIKAAE